MRRLFGAIRDLSLRGKVTLTLAAVFTGSVVVLLLALVPILREQRERLVEQDRRLLTTLRRNFERYFIHDLLSENRESLAVHLGALVGEEGIVWARIEAEGLDLGATADSSAIRRLLGEEVEPYLGEQELVLVLDQEGHAELVGVGGRTLLTDLQVRREAARPAAPAADGDEFRETIWNGQRVLALTATLSAPGQSFGRLHLLYSLAPLERSEALTRSLFYGGVTLTFVLVLLLLNPLLSRMVLTPVRRVHDAMSRAATGDLQVRLPVPSRDEVGRMAESFNRMVGELETSRREVEGYSRNLEAMVEARTAQLRDSEASLLTLKNHLSTVIANVGTGVFSLDAEGRIEAFNDRAGQIFGVPPSAAHGRSLEEALGGAETSHLVEVVADVRDGRVPRREAQVLCRLPQGRRTLSVVASALFGEGRRPIGTVVVCEDLTQILASQRLEAWKEAVERVIHEIKNPLTPVGLAADTLKNAWQNDRARFGELFPSAIEMIQGAVRDLKVLIGDFSRFSRLPKMRPERGDPNALVLDALAPYSQSSPEGLVVRVDLAPDVPEVEADSDQIKRVLLNVINNALDAMDGREGELRLSTRAEEGEVVIRVDDNGPGLEDVERIFEPHYTTKVKGTGLGLAIARQIVAEHGGRIDAESTPGRGTSVRIHLPEARPARPSEQGGD
ncbi:MAG: HAMP domain-containing protein [Acidobacteria bacterium]|jgi:PAS domain S-box-containing protein|nr:HAMP domain-containing protein [Acidobacteriota bacterium]